MTNFDDAYIERCNKETETMIKTESSHFLEQAITYLKENKNEFIYLETVLFESIGVEGISLEQDDVFGTYDVMLGLKLQKKLDKPIKEYLDTHLLGEQAKYDLMFSNEDGLWELNFALNYVDGFQEKMTLKEAFQLIHQFLTNLVHTVKP